MAGLCDDEPLLLCFFALDQNSQTFYLASSRSLERANRLIKQAANHSCLDDQPLLREPITGAKQNSFERIIKPNFRLLDNQRNTLHCVISGISLKLHKVLKIHHHQLTLCKKPTSSPKSKLFLKLNASSLIIDLYFSKDCQLQFLAACFCLTYPVPIKPQKVPYSPFVEVQEAI
ncbi:hypothetical protein ACU8KH_05340 [Lachancea thermotolerans]